MFYFFCWQLGSNSLLSQSLSRKKKRWRLYRDDGGELEEGEGGGGGEVVGATVVVIGEDEVGDDGENGDNEGEEGEAGP